MKMKRMMPLMMAAMLAATSLPLSARASSATEDGTVTQETIDESIANDDTTDESTTGGSATGSSATDSTTTDEPAAEEDTIDESTTDESATDESAADESTADSVTTDDNAEAATTEEGTADADKEDSDDTEDTADIAGNDAMNDENSNLVVTLGENLSDAQKATMYQYFGVGAGTVNTITVTHADEVKYMEGIATSEQIGSNTVSCAYIEPTTSGGIKVKTANLNFVTSQMIASALTTAGMENCNVVAACPFQVSGTGALTGIIMAYETASGETLDEGKKQAANEEIVVTGDLSDAVGEDKATEVINDAKTEIIDKGLTDSEEIGKAVQSIAEDNDVELTEEQKAQVVDLLQNISKYDYDLNSIQNTLDGLNEEVGGLSKAWDSVKSFFVGSGDGILNDTDDSALGDGVVTTSTVDDSGFKDGLITRIKNFFSGK